YGGVELEVLGPVRRYESLNEQSLVIMVRAAAGDVLLTGDIETLAQNDLGPIGANILKVPHHGGATSSLAWLQAADPELAVISVGENDYGHPSPKVVEALVEIGASVVRTDQAGDVVVPLGEEAVSLAPVAAIDRSP
ncbi:MAG: ComEC/Rec2 family competence protein, partial [Acidimicrobiia bacterium]